MLTSAVLTIVANVGLATGPRFWGPRGLLKYILFITLYIRFFQSKKSVFF